MSIQDRQIDAGGPRRATVFAFVFAVLFFGALVPVVGAHYAYVVNRESSSVSTIDTVTNQAVGPAIQVGAYPGDIAISPDGRRAYVTTPVDGVYVIDTETNLVTWPPIAFSEQPRRIAITPDGGTAYMSNVFSESVSVMDLQLNRQMGPSIPVRSEPTGIAIGPDGKTAYVLEGTAGKTGLTVLDIWTNGVVTTIPLGPMPIGLAVTPDGRKVYVAEGSWDPSSRGVWVVDAESKKVVGRIPMPDPRGSRAIAMSPAGGRVYVLDSGGNVSVIDTDSDEVVGFPIPVEADATDIAIAPDGRTAYVSNYFSNSVTTIDTGTGEVVAARIPVGTGPGPIAITEDLPSVRVGCPEGSVDRCRLSIQAVTDRQRGRAQSTVTNVKLRSKRPRLVPLKPKRRFSGRIARAGRLLVKETVEIRGTRRTTYRRLKVFRPSHPGES